MTESSKLWLDYVSSDIIHNKTGIKEIEQFMNNMGKIGEPFINGFNKIDSLAKAHNLQVLLIKTPQRN